MASIPAACIASAAVPRCCRTPAALRRLPVTPGLSDYLGFVVPLAAAWRDSDVLLCLQLSRQLTVRTEVALRMGHIGMLLPRAATLTVLCQQSQIMSLPLTA